MNRKILSFVLISIYLLPLAACSQQAGPAESVAVYIQALTDKNLDKLIGVSCAAWEESARVEMDSFEIVETRVEGLACQEAGTDGDLHLVTCQGKIMTSYNGENQELDLSAITYQVTQEAGEWRVCGYR